MEIRRLYPAEIDALRAQLFKVVRCIESRPADGPAHFSRQQETTKPFYDMLANTENFAIIECELTPDEYAALMPLKTYK